MSQNAANFSVGTDNAIARYDTTAGAVLQNSVPTIDDTGNLSISAAVSGASLSATVANTSNTASATAFYNAQVAGSTASDAYYKAEISGGQAWTLGLDNSASDRFSISASSTLGTSEALSITTGGNASFNKIGTNAEIFVAAINADNNTASNARVVAVVTNASADPYMEVAHLSTAAYCWGIDNSDSDKLKINYNTGSVDPSSGSNLWNMTTSGERTMPLQPAFMARAGAVADVTGDNTVYTLIFGTEIFDQGGDFDGTSTFTAPVTGRYLLSATISFDQLTASHTQAIGTIVTSNRPYRTFQINAANARDSSNALILSGTSLCDMDAADTATVTLQVSNGTKVVDILTTTPTFMGNLVC